MKLLFFLLTLSLALSLHAQDKFFEEPIGWRGKSIALHAISDHAKKEECLFLCKDDSIRAFVLDNKQAVIQHFYFNRLKDEQFLVGFIKEGTVYAFFQPPAGNSDLHVWTLNIDRGIGDDYMFSFAMRHERAVEQISAGDHFLYFTISKKESVFSIYDFYDDKRCDTMHYQFEGKIWKALTSYNGGFGRDVDVVKVDPDARMNPDMAHSPNKLYWRQDTLFLLMNGYQKGITTIYSFDMRGKKTNLREIRHNNARCYWMENCISFPPRTTN